jgi:hypothetical protein
VTWVKLDDHFADHPKIERLSSDAFRSFIHGLCYCSRQLTDGHIPKRSLRRIASKRVEVELKAAGLWEQNSDGILVRSYLEYQPSAQKIREKRAADSARKAGGSD